MTDDDRAKKGEALLEIREAEQSVTTCQEQLASIQADFSGLAQALKEFTRRITTVPSMSGTRRVIDRQKVSALPTGADVLNAMDALDRERKRLQAAQREAKRLGIA